MSFYIKLIYFKTFSFVSKLNVLGRVILSLSILSLTTCTLYFKFYAKSKSEIQLELSKIKTEEAQLQSLKKIIEKYSDDEIEIENLNSGISCLLKENSESCDQIIQEILQYAQSSNLIVHNFEEHELINKESFSKKKVSFELFGDFYKVLNFLQTIANGYNIVKFNEFKVNRLKEGILKIKLECSIYSQLGQ